jgi:pimeloyl-ACP methyl ester carboxylesterase
MIQQKNKSINGIAYHKIGKGPAIILIHGLGLRSESWIEQIRFLKKYYTVYSIDLPGHGKSNPLPQHKTTLNGYCAEITKFIRLNNIDKPVLIGHSLGALITIEIAGNNPNFLKSGIAISSVYKRTKDALRRVQKRAKEIKENPTEEVIVNKLLERWFGNSKSFTINNHLKFIRELLLLNKKNNLEGYASAYDLFSKLDGNSTKTINNIKVPMLFITGEKDLNSTPAMSKKLAIINNQSYVVVKGARHMVPLTHSKQFNFHLIKFIKSLH